MKLSAVLKVISYFSGTLKEDSGRPKKKRLVKSNVQFEQLVERYRTSVLVYRGR